MNSLFSYWDLYLLWLKLDNIISPLFLTWFSNNHYAMVEKLLRSTTLRILAILAGKRMKSFESSRLLSKLEVNNQFNNRIVNSLMDARGQAWAVLTVMCPLKPFNAVHIYNSFTTSSHHYTELRLIGQSSLLVTTDWYFKPKEKQSA